MCAFLYGHVTSYFLEGQHVVPSLWCYLHVSSTILNKLGLARHSHFRCDVIIE